MEEDPFQHIGVEPRFDVDPAIIESKLLRATARLHPDRAADEIEAAEWGRELAAINAAARTLLNDEHRADALLRLLGGPAASDEKGLPDGFLQGILATRMELEEALATGDSEGRSRLESWAHEERSGHRSRIGDLFGRFESQGDKALLREIRLELNRWRYVERMIEQMDPGFLAGTDVPE
ncbi:MAG: hypothetical protein MK085_10710 [Phycisphaerales bacterium]|nr:hypothetical protein [Phycisphaerales bacterium]